MKIGGFHPASFNNYPGRVAAVVFTQGCNFCCPYCHNFQLISCNRSTRFDEQYILSRLAARKGKLAGVVISGGEPTLQNDLRFFCHRIHALGYPVKVDTNGSRPAVLAELLADKVVDCIAIDIKAPLQKYAQLAGVAVDTEAICQSIVLIAGSGVPHLFRTTFVESLLSARDLEDIRKLVPIGSPYTVQQFKEVNRPAASDWLRGIRPESSAR